MTIQFFQTPMGRTYYEHTLPALIKSLNRLAKALEEHSEQLRVGKTMEILALPNHLRQTLTSLYKLGGEATAEQVSKQTGKARAVESGYLTQLENRNLIRKKKKGRITIFSLTVTSDV